MNMSEVFDAMLRADAEAQRAARIREIDAAIRTIGTMCGDCAKWMTKSCPAERNRNGRRTGPGCASPVCSKYVDDWSLSRRREKLTAERALLKASGGSDV
jgi:hypothetical protein